MANIIVLGAGLVGGVMAKDLALTHDVTCVDISEENLAKLNGIKTICADISNTTKLKSLIADFDLVIGAVPGFLELNCVQTEGSASLKRPSKAAF